MNVRKDMLARIVPSVLKDGGNGRIVLNSFQIQSRQMMADIFVTNVKKITLDIIVIDVRMVLMCPRKQ
jgi:hypothetical protein